MGRPSRPFLDHPGPIPFAHRGDHRDPSIEENSLGAFAEAISLGYRYVETDVHSTLDGKLVVIHDHRLNRVTDRTGVVAEMPWSEVRKARLAGGETIPLLEDVLGTWPDLMVNIEPKHYAAVAPLMDVLTRTRALDRVCVGAFSLRRLAYVRRTSNDQVCTSTAPIEVARLRAAGFGTPIGRLAADCVQVPARQGPLVIVDRRFVQTAHRLGLPVHVWTVDDPTEMRRLLDLGVDGLMSDRPDLLKQVLIERGQWN